METPGTLARDTTREQTNTGSFNSNQRAAFDAGSESGKPIGEFTELELGRHLIERN